MYCAIIGDLIGSKKIEPEQRAAVQVRLRQLLDEMNEKYSDYMVSPFLLTLGDEFQGLLTASEAALEITEYIDRGLAEHSVRIRYGLGLGEISTGSVNREQALGDDGSVYHRAREGVELLKKKKWKGFPVAIRTGEVDEELLWSVCQLLNDLAEDWNPAQRQYVLDMEQLGEQQLVAEKNRTQQSGVSRALKRAHYKTYRKAKEDLKQYLLSKYDSPLSAGRMGQYNRAAALERNNECAQALEILERLLEEPGEGNGEEMPTRGDILTLAGKCCLQLGRYEKAEKWLQEAVAEEEKSGSSESRLVDRYAWLGNCYISMSFEARRRKDHQREQEQAQKAIHVLKQADARCANQSALGGRLRGNLALAYGITEGPEKEIELREKFLEWLEEQPGENLTARCIALHNLARVYWHSGKKQQAQTFSERAVQLANQMMLQSPDMAEIYRTYGLILMEGGEKEKAVHHLEKALSLAKRGKDHELTIKICIVLEKLYQSAGNDEARIWTMEQRLRAEQAQLKKQKKEQPRAEDLLIDT